MSGKIDVEDVAQESIESVDSDFRAGVLGRPSIGSTALAADNNQ